MRRRDGRPRQAYSRTAWAARIILCASVLAAAASASGEWSFWNRESVPEPDYPDVTVGIDRLARDLGASGFIVVDARPRQSYLRGHIASAVSIPPEDLPGLGETAHMDALPAALGELGLTGRERFVCYGDSSYSGSAARLFWLLEASGATRVAVLDGGLSAWVAAGKRATREETKLPPTRWRPRPRPDLVATREYVRRSFGEPGVEIIDARGWDAWTGPIDRSDWGTPVRAGHIPHALPFSFREFVNPDGTFKDPPDTWSSFAKLGPRPSNPVNLEDEFIVHGDGVTGNGAVGYYLLRRAGIARIRYYPGGWDDWVGDPYLPIVRIVGAEELEWRLAKARHWYRPGAPPETFAFFDVRHPGDHEGGHIRGAVSLRSDYFADSLDVRLEKYWPDIDRAETPVVTYCYGKRCIRSRATSTAAARGGFVHVERFYDGLDGWRTIGGELVKGK